MDKGNSRKVLTYMATKFALDDKMTSGFLVILIDWVYHLDNRTICIFHCSLLLKGSPGSSAESQNLNDRETWDPRGRLREQPCQQTAFASAFWPSLSLLGLKDAQQK